MAEPQQRLLILYATQTGCAQELAEKICRDASRRNFDSTLCSMDNYDRSNLINEQLVLFLASTTGDGDPPDPMRTFWRFLLRKALPKDVLNGMNFAVFGLGDSSYDKFNSVGRKLRKRLLQLGAEEVAPPGWGDDQSVYGVEGDFDQWSQQMWKVMLRKYPLPHGFVIDDSPRLPQFDSVLKYGVPGDLRVGLQRYVESLWVPAGVEGGVLMGVLRKKDKLCREGWEQDVRHVEVELPRDVRYEAGDIAVVYPENVEVDVEKLGERLGMDPSAVVTVEKADGEVVYGPCTVGDLFRKYLGG